MERNALISRLLTLGLALQSHTMIGGGQHLQCARHANREVYVPQDL